MDEDLMLLGAEYLLGEDDDYDDPILGARAKRLRRSSRSARRALRRGVVPKTPGVPTPGAREWPLPFPAIQFTNTSALAINSASQPQRPFKGKRLVVDLARTANALELVTITGILVGQSNQLIAAGALPSGGFAPGAFHTDLNLDPCTPGITITVQFACAANPGVGETIDVATMIVGLAIG